MEGKPNFPYKTLIWALFALIALFVFKNELKRFLTDAEKLSVFGVEINASREQVNKLQDSIQNFETTVADLSSQITNQQNKINDLDQLKTQLEQDLAECPEAKITAIRFNEQVSKIFNANKDLKTKSDKLKNSSILKISTYNVKLIVPSNMLNANIYVDGKQANIINKSGVFITVRVKKKEGSHRFDIKDGTRQCTSNKLITRDAMEVPIVCGF